MTLGFQSQGHLVILQLISALCSNAGLLRTKILIHIWLDHGAIWYKQKEFIIAVVNTIEGPATDYQIDMDKATLFLN